MSLGLFDFSGYGPRPVELEEGWSVHRWEIDGFKLMRATSLPGLEDPCGANFCYRDLIGCGETQAAVGVARRLSENSNRNEGKTD